MTNLEKISTKPPDSATKASCKERLKEYRRRLFDLQNVFYANGNHAMLIVLQGTDASGKDGTIRHVMTCMNPMGVNVTAFGKPTETELKHDFMWRIYPHIPGKGFIKVFNRSYYEDMIVPMVQKSISKERLKHRCGLINHLEQHWMRNNIHVLKFYLHISQEEQNKKIEERLQKPHKKWKYSREDHKTDHEWEAYTHAYNAVLKNCNEPGWHVIPADKKWYRNYMVAKILTEYLEGLNLHYPE